MKRIILLLLLAGSAKAQDGLHIGAKLGITCDRYYSNVTKTEAWRPASFAIGFPVAYESNNWLIEWQGIYTGAIIMNFTAGYSIPLSETVKLQLLAGAADNVLITKQPFQAVHKFHPTGIIRLQAGDFFAEYQQIQSTSIFTLGFKGLANQTTY